MEHKRRKIACIVGPTAAGKTALSILLAKRLRTEIVSADSVQVYRGLDIGSAKPTLEERQGIPHHLIDCVAVDQPGFSVSQYKEMAGEAIESIWERGRVPLVVGGSGLYVHALTYPLNFAIPSDPVVRRELEVEYAPERQQDAWEKLRQIDPETANRLHPNDRKRIIRALEVFVCSGKPLSAYGNDFVNAEGREAPYDSILIGLRMERAALYERIDKRVDCMLEQGLLDEVRRLSSLGLSRRLPALQSIGYRQLLEYLDGQVSYEEAVEHIKQETRRFAKRQISWFKRDKRIIWYDVPDNPLDWIAEQAADQIGCWLNGEKTSEDQ